MVKEELNQKGNLSIHYLGPFRPSPMVMGPMVSTEEQLRGPWPLEASPERRF